MSHIYYTATSEVRVFATENQKESFNNLCCANQIVLQIK